MRPQLHSFLRQLFGNKQTSSHSPIFNLAPTISSSSLTTIQIPSLCLSKAQGGINKRSAQQVMEDKQRQVVWLPRDCAHNVSVWAVNKLMVCISVAAVVAVVVVLLCEERGSWGGSLCGCFGREGWLSGAKLDLFSSSTFPCGSTTHKPAEQRHHTRSSVHLLLYLHLSLKVYCLLTFYDSNLSMMPHTLKFFLLTNFLPKIEWAYWFKIFFPCTTKCSLVSRSKKMMIIMVYCKGGRWWQLRKMLPVIESEEKNWKKMQMKCWLCNIEE